MRSPLPAAALGLLAAISTAPVAHASSPDAWAEFEARATKACVTASGIRNGRASAIVGFDDRAGMVAMLVSPPRRGASPPRLCLYDKRARAAHIDEAAGWTAPPQRR